MSTRVASQTGKRTARCGAPQSVLRRNRLRDGLLTFKTPAGSTKPTFPPSRWTDPSNPISGGGSWIGSVGSLCDWYGQLSFSEASESPATSISQGQHPPIRRRNAVIQSFQTWRPRRSPPPTSSRAVQPVVTGSPRKSLRSTPVGPLHDAPHSGACTNTVFERRLEAPGVA